MPHASKAFMDAAAAIEAANAAFARNALSPIAHRNARETALGEALVAMAADYGVTLQSPIFVDSRGEMPILSLHPSGCSPKVRTSPFGEEFAAVLARYQPRMGVEPSNYVSPQNGWCWMNHFQVERMVTDRYGEIPPEDRYGHAVGGTVGAAGTDEGRPRPAGG